MTMQNRVRAKKRIMIIEDDAILAMDLSNQIVSLGLSVVGVARTRAAAIVMARQTCPDVIVSDVALADQSSGIDAAKEITRFLPGIPIVFTTGYPQLLQSSDATQKNYIVTKPFRDEQFAAVIETAIG